MPTIEYGPPPERGVSKLQYVGDDGVETPAGGGLSLRRVLWLALGFCVGKKIFSSRT